LVGAIDLNRPACSGEPLYRFIKERLIEPWRPELAQTSGAVSRLLSEIADLELAGFFDENDLQIEVRIKTWSFFNSSTVMPCLWATFASSCGDSSVWI